MVDMAVKTPVFVPNMRQSGSLDHAWAAAVALIGCAQDVGDERRARIERFRLAIMKAIRPWFQRPNPANAPAAVQAMADVFANSEWAYLFKREELRNEALGVIRAQLQTARDAVVLRRN